MRTRLCLALLSLALVGADAPLSPSQCYEQARKAIDYRYRELVELVELLARMERQGSGEARALARIVRKHVRLDIEELQHAAVLRKRECGSAVR